MFACAHALTDGGRNWLAARRVTVNVCDTELTEDPTSPHTHTHTETEIVGKQSSSAKANEPAWNAIPVAP